MKEVISLNVGEQGIRVGSQFWKMISREHGLNERGQLSCSSQDRLDKIGVFWEENMRGLEVTYRPRRIDVEDMENVTNTTERIRKEVERCDNFQGFQFCQSIEETKGMLHQVIKEEYPSKIVKSYLMTQGKSVENKLMLSDLKSNFDSIVLFDAKKMKEIYRTQNMNSDTDACHLVARVMADVTSLFRFPSQV